MQFVAMAVGMIPPVRAVLFDSSGPLRFVTDSIGILGQAMIPCILLVLGGNLVGGELYTSGWMTVRRDYASRMSDDVDRCVCVYLI